WLLRGAPQAVLTTIDNEPEHLAAARQAFADARIPPAKSRFITGRAADVLPRMNESAYDIVLVDADPENVIEYVEHGLRLVRTGGMVLVPRVLAGGRVADPVQRDAVTAAYRSLIQETQDSPAVLATVSTAGDGLLQLGTLPHTDCPGRPSRRNDQGRGSDRIPAPACCSCQAAPTTAPSTS